MKCSLALLLLACAYNLSLPAPAAAEGGGKEAEKLQKVAEELALRGAKLQAERLRAVAWWNWEMRRALKEFLYLVEVRGLAPALPCFPVDASGKRISYCPQVAGDTRFDFAFVDPREETKEGGANFFPTACVIFEPTNNYCQKSGWPGANERRQSSFTLADPMSLPRDSQLLEKKIADCSGRTDVNLEFLRAWLFGIDLFPPPGRAQEDAFPRIQGFSRIGYLPRMAAIRARIESLERLVKEPRGPLGTEANLLLEKEGIPAGELNVTEEIQPLKLEELSAPVTVSTEVFETRGRLDRGDCFHFRELRTIPRFPLGMRVAALPRYEVKLWAVISGRVYEARAAAGLNGGNIGPVPEEEGGIGKVYLASAVAHAGQKKGEAGPGFPNPLVMLAEDDAEKGGFSRSSHLGYLRGASFGFDNFRAGLRLAGAISPWEERRYLLGCGNASRPKIPEPSLLEPGPRGRLRLQERVADYLGVNMATMPFVKKVLPDSRLESYFRKLEGEKGWLSLEQIPDPYLDGDYELAAYARKHGTAFTAQPDPGRAACELPVRLLPPSN